MAYVAEKYFYQQFRISFSPVWVGGGARRN
jgi:hypothetical protein